VRAIKPTELLLIRHGQSTANSKGILAGRDESIELSELGLMQAKQLANFLSEKKVDRIYSSPLKRCLQTITPLGKSVGKKVLLEESFIEMHYGDWSGEKLSKLAKKPEWKTIQENPGSFTFPGGESFKGMQQRVKKRIPEILLPGKTIVVCSHGDVIKMILASLMGLKLNDFQQFVIEPASISILSIGNRNTLIRSNSTAHLSGSGSAKAKSPLKANPSVLGGGDIAK
jgi:probable phosphoglycerate mutase